MCCTTPLEAYASDICSAAKTISAYCASEGLPHPSFDFQAPSVTIPSNAPPTVQDARRSIISAAVKIQQLATEPADYLPSLAVHYQHLACVRWLCRFNILACIPLHGSCLYSEIASTAGVPEAQLRSVARMAMTSNFLCEPRPNEVGHNAVSALFVINPGLVDWARIMTEFSMPAAAAFVEATEKWGATEQKNQTAFNIAFHTELPLFAFVGKSPELTKRFATYMKNVQASEGTSLKHLLSGFDWAGLGEAVVVDVGGSTCSSSIALANTFPKLRFVVQDLPDTVANSNAILSSQPSSVRERITFQGHDFFTPQPYKGANVYLLRMILHDWPAAEATSILKNLLDALKANRDPRLIIMDTVLPVPGSISTVEEALLRVRDLTMTQFFNSKERELGEWTDLFAQASDRDGKLVLRNTVKPPGSSMSVMEVVYQAHSDEGSAKEQVKLVNGANGLAHGASNGVTNGMTDGVTNGVTSGLTNGVSTA